MTDNETTNGVILERVDQIRSDIHLLAGKVENLATNVQQFQISYATEHTKVVEQTSSAHRRLDEHQGQITKLINTTSDSEKLVIQIQEQVKQMRNIIVGLAVVVVPLIAGLVWELLTHQITFP